MRRYPSDSPIPALFGKSLSEQPPDIARETVGSRSS
jgi:hypothetical protein